MLVIAPPPPAKGIRSHGLPPGVQAPELGVPATPDGRKVTLADYKGSALVLVFYPADFTPVCTSELGIFNELLPEFGNLGARVLGVSCDSIWAHIAFARELHLQIPLLSDFHPKGELSRRYKVYREEDGFSERALFVIDREGIIAWSHVSPLEVNPGADGVLEALERLSGKRLDESINPPQTQPGARP
jgi:peroxiredoxin (alkyl hydroperoxide reductase subunit C)